MKSFTQEAENFLLTSTFSKMCQNINIFFGNEIFVTLIFNSHTEELLSQSNELWTNYFSILQSQEQTEHFVIWEDHEKFVSYGWARAGKIAPSWPSNKQVCWPRNACFPHLTPFFPYFALHGPHFPAAWLIGCVILNATLQLKWIAVSSRLALATWRIGSCQWRLPIQFYISYTYIYQFIAFFEGVAASCVYLACQWVWPTIDAQISLHFPRSLLLVSISFYLYIYVFVKLILRLAVLTPSSLACLGQRLSCVSVCGKNSCRQLQLIAASCKNKDSSGLRQQLGG